MTGIKATVNGANIVLEVTGVLTGGMVGVPVTFSYDEAWEGLSKTAVFRAGGLTVDVVGVETDTTVPWEVLRKIGCTLYVGVYGTAEDGSAVIPTLWAEAGEILPGADPSGDEGTDPSLPVWADATRKSAEALHIAQSIRDDADAGAFNGAPGLPGEKGYTPVRGVDYWTDADKEEIKSYIEVAVNKYLAESDNLATTEYVNESISTAIIGAIGGSY